LTVKELIELLENMPSDHAVVFVCPESDHSWDIEKVVVSPTERRAVELQ
jgi:hypothetical protein